MSDTKQFVYKDANGNLTTTPTSETFGVSSVGYGTQIVPPYATFRKSSLTNGPSDGTAWQITWYTGSPELAKASGGINSSQSGINKLVCDLSHGDPRSGYDSVLTVDKCKAAVTGQYVPKLQILEGNTNTGHPHYYSIDYNENLSGSNDFSQQYNLSDRGSYITADDPMDGFGGGTVTFTSTGSAVTGGEQTPHTDLGWDLDIYAPGQSGWRGATFQIDPRVNPAGSQEPRLYFLGTVQRSWEANLFAIDGVGNDSIDPISVSSTLTCEANYKYDISKNLSTTTAVEELSFNQIFGQCEISINSVFEKQIAFKLGIDQDITTTADLIASTANLKLADATLQAATTQASDGHVIFGITDELTAQVSTSTSAGLIYDITGDYTWDSFNLNSYFEPGYSIDNFALDQGEYTWNFLADADWDSWPVSTWLGNEQTWDNWPDDVWEKPYIIGTAGSLITIPSFILGDVVTYTGTFTFDEDSAFEQASQAGLTAQFTTNFTASGVIDVEADLSGAFAPSLTANISYSLDDTPIVITGAFTPVLTANAITDTFADIDVAFTFAVEPTFKPSGQSTITTATEFDLAPTFKPAGFSAMVASAGTLTVGRIFYSADPYNTTKISQEIRRIVLPEENRQTLVMAENRLNTITQETGDYLVPQETRSIKLRIPPFSNRFSTPRVRSSQ